MALIRPSYRGPVDGSLATRLKALLKSASEKYEHLCRVAQHTRAMSDGLYEEALRAREARDHDLAELAHFERRHRPDAAFEHKDDPETGAAKNRCGSAADAETSSDVTGGSGR